MAIYKEAKDQATAIEWFDRIKLHHDHIKTLDREYAFMRNKQTLDLMRTADFSFDNEAMANLDEACFTSLIIRLEENAGESFFAKLREAYQKFSELILQYLPKAKVELNFEAAHITVKSLLDNVQQTQDDLKAYLPVVTPVVSKWLDSFSVATQLRAVGLFTNVHKAKGLSIGVRFFPSLPLIQVLRGELGMALYSDARTKPLLRPETMFHTMLTHSTGLRARNLAVPFSSEFVNAFQSMLETFDNVYFGSIENITLSDFYIRNGVSDKLCLGSEVCLSNERVI